MVGAVLVLSVFAFTACEGPTGAQGPQGPTGENLIRVTSNLDIFSTGNTAGDVDGQIPENIEVTVVGTTLLYNALEYVPTDASRTFTPRFYLYNTGFQVSGTLVVTVLAPTLNPNPVPWGEAGENQLAFTATDPVTGTALQAIPSAEPGVNSFSINLPAGQRVPIRILPYDTDMWEDAEDGATADWFGLETPFSHGAVNLSYTLPYGGSASRTHDIHFIRPRRQLDPPTFPMISITPDTATLTWTAPPAPDDFVDGTLAAEPARAGRYIAYLVYTGNAVLQNGTLVAPQAMSPSTDSAPIGATYIELDESHFPAGDHFVSVVAQGVRHQVAGPVGSATLGIWRDLTFNSGRLGSVGFTTTPRLTAPVLTLTDSIITWTMVEGAGTFVIYRGDVDSQRRPIGNYTPFATITVPGGTALDHEFSFDILGGANLVGEANLNIGFNSMSIVAVPTTPEIFVPLGGIGWRESAHSNVDLFRYR